MLSQVGVQPLEGPVARDGKEPSALNCRMMDAFLAAEGGSGDLQAVAHPCVGCRLHERLAEDNGVLQGVLRLNCRRDPLPGNLIIYVLDAPLDDVKYRRCI